MKLMIRFVFIVVAGLLAASTHADQSADAVIVEVTGGKLLPNGAFNVLTYEVEQDMTLSATGLREAGLAAGPIVLRSDEIRIYTSRAVMNAAPLARIWLNARENGHYWFHTGGSGSAEQFVIPKGAAVVVWTRASTTSIAWDNVFR